MGKAKKSYAPAPAVPARMMQRYTVMLEVLAGRITVSEAARTLGMSRNHFQTLMHRGMSGLLESITPKEGGRPAKGPGLSSLQQELDRLQRENAQLQERLGTTDRLLQAASGLLQGRIRPARQPRQRKTRSAADEDSEAEPRRTRVLREVERMKALGFTAAMAASVLGLHASTVRRWKRQAGEPAGCARRCDAPEPRAVERAEELVRRLHGQVGAESLRHSVTGLSRRQAAGIKARTLTQMERSRKRGLMRVRVTQPGVMRAMDGLQVRSADGPLHALIAADACVPYRTMVKVGSHYDAALVATTLEADIEVHGAPLVYRLDRARAHDARPVRELLEHYGVLLLHGPPHCARFYGQLERQNREHRAWDQDLEGLPAYAIEPCIQRAIEDLNSLWRRRSLDWRTASEVWDNRIEPHIDRCELRDEVNERAARIGRHLQDRGLPADLAQRLAIEQALETRGYLRQTVGGWC